MATAQQRPPGPGAGVLAAVDHNDAVDDGVVDALGVRPGILERIRVADGRGVEDRDIGCQTFMDLSTIRQPEDLRGE